MKYLLDTDHISILQRQSEPQYANLMSRITRHAPEDFAFSIISFHEQLLGCHTYISHARTSGDVVRGYGMLARVLEDFAIAAVLLFDADAAAVYDRLVAQRVRVPTMDLRIASIALSRSLVLATRNASDFRKAAGLRIEDWTE